MNHIAISILGILAGAPAAVTDSAVGAPATRAARAFPIQSHRGAGNLAPENTLPTFELGWKLGTIPEADVRMTKDGVIVAFHDDNFARLVKDASPELKRKGIADLTWDEVAGIDVGSWKGDEFAGQRVPRITDVFEAMRGRPDRMLYLDVKKVSLERLARIGAEHGVERQLILASTKYPELREWKALSPKSQTLLWMGGTEEKLKGRLAEVRATGFADITQLQIHVRLTEPGAAEPFMPSRAFLRETGRELKRHSILFQVLPWNTKDPGVYRALLDLGVESFATDDPVVTLKVVNDHAAQRD